MLYLRHIVYPLRTFIFINNIFKTGNIRLNASNYHSTTNRVCYPTLVAHHLTRINKPIVSRVASGWPKTRDASAFEIKNKLTCDYGRRWRTASTEFWREWDRIWREWNKSYQEFEVSFFFQGCAAIFSLEIFCDARKVTSEIIVNK